MFSSPRKRDLVLGLTSAATTFGVITAVLLVLPRWEKTAGYKNKLKYAAGVAAFVCVSAGAAALGVYLFFDDSRVPENYEHFRVKVHDAIKTDRAVKSRQLRRPLTSEASASDMMEAKGGIIAL